MNYFREMKITSKQLEGLLISRRSLLKETSGRHLYSIEPAFGDRQSFGVSIADDSLAIQLKQLKDVNNALWDAAILPNKQSGNETVQVGSTFFVKEYDADNGTYGDEERLSLTDGQIVFKEACVSTESPFGKEVFGKEVGDFLHVNPHNSSSIIKYQIVGIQKSETVEYLNDGLSSHRTCYAASKDISIMKKRGPEFKPFTMNFGERECTFGKPLQYKGQEYDEFFVLSPSQWVLAYNEYRSILERGISDNGRLRFLRKMLHKRIAQTPNDGSIGVGSFVKLELTDPEGETIIIEGEYILRALSYEVKTCYIEWISNLGYAIDGKKEGDPFSYVVGEPFGNGNSDSVDFVYRGRVLSVFNDYEDKFDTTLVDEKEKEKKKKNREYRKKGI